ncbi:MAG: hypothetical protein JW830_06465 [Bacteroidales bacterium]|nr:hypothetical protein [Bacteroidales bacterium]
MITKDNCILLGTLTKPHGTKGLALIRLKDLKAEDIKKGGSVFVEIDGLLVPFFMESFQERSADSIILKLEGIQSETGLKELTGSNVYVLASQIKRKRKMLSGIPQLSGYRVKDLHTGFTGTAGEITGMASNPLLQVYHEGHEYLVPVHEDIILEINDKERMIVIEAPEGLFDL